MILVLINSLIRLSGHPNLSTTTIATSMVWYIWHYSERKYARANPSRCLHIGAGATKFYEQRSIWIDTHHGTDVVQCSTHPDLGSTATILTRPVRKWIWATFCPWNNIYCNNIIGDRELVGYLHCQKMSWSYFWSQGSCFDWHSLRHTFSYHVGKTTCILYSQFHFHSKQFLNLEPYSLWTWKTTIVARLMVLSNYY